LLKQYLGNTAGSPEIPVYVAFTPKGGCLLKLSCGLIRLTGSAEPVAFTPKGGCLLKQLGWLRKLARLLTACSIHPQGWVLVETINDRNPYSKQP